MQYPEDFQQDSESSIWLPHQEQFAFQYSDGGEAEAYLENCLRQASDLSSHSVELASLIRDWPSEYHFSLKRSNLLRPLRLNHCRNVLELGAGCGAITRYLGENISRVVAVEGSRNRAKITTLRCRDLDNVEIVCGQFQDIKFSEKFDIVTLIGVLEYSNFYIQSVNSYQRAIEIAKQNLADNGILLLAIENQLGLKYFAGCSEDHTKILFDGIEGYNSGQLVRTFGKQELEVLLKSAGLEYCHFLYPFPDYKLPDVILSLSEEKQSQTQPFLYQWLGYDNSRDYSNKQLALFQELLAAKQLEANGLLSQMSNSFLVLASQSPGNIAPYLTENCLVWKFSVMNRLKKFMSQVTLTRDDESQLMVTKEPLYPDLAAGETGADDSLIHYSKIQSKFFAGITVMEQIVQAIRNKTATVEPSLKYPLKTWYDFLRQEANRTIGSDTEIPGIYVDCSPGNLIVTPGGKVEYVDQEWSFREKLPIKFVFFRGLLYLYQKIHPWIDLYLNDFLSDKSLPAFIWFCFQLVSVELTAAEFRNFLEKEWIFQKQVNPLLKQVSFDDYLSGVNYTAESLLVGKAPYQLWFQLYKTKDELQQTKENLQQSHSQLQQTQQQLQQTQQQLQQTQDTVTGMESSKFWQLRQGWFKLKQTLGLKGDK